MVSRADITLFQKDRLLRMQNGVRGLLKGNFATGWEDYRYRNEIHWFDRRFNKPYWKGQDLKGKSIILMYEQAIGEQIYFASIVPDLVARGANVILEVDSRLVTIMQRSFPTVTVIPYEFPWHEAGFEADYQCFLGTAMSYLRPSFESFPDRKSYLVPDPEVVSKLKGYEGRIGLSWFSKAQHYSAAKNVPFDLFKPLIERKACISVQYGQYNALIERIHNFDITQDLENCAALLSICSKVITVSNATAHLAGALGVDTSVLVPNAIGRHFYWYPERETVPNYPSASAYLQMPAKDWKPLIEYLTKKELDN